MKREILRKSSTKNRKWYLKKTKIIP